VRVVFVNWAFENHGSAQDLHNYTQVAQALGHEVVLYGPPRAGSPFAYSLDLSPADAVVLVFEFTTYLQYGDRLDLARLVGRVPRQRRVILDCDGKYNDALAVVGDANHPDAEASRRWVEVCDSLSDKVYQPTLRPLRPNVGTFLFHGYNPAWERPLDFRTKPCGMAYVGNNWFRWRALQRVLLAVEPVRERLGRIALVGQGWDSAKPWGGPTFLPEAYATDPDYLARLRVEVLGPVPFDRVIGQMGRGVFNPVLLRPLFDHLRLVTCRTFETPAAGTLPLFCQEPAYVTEIYGDEAAELVLPEERPADKVLDLLRRPRYYARIVECIRRRLAEHHSYAVRLQELVRIVES
jgi:hypothetical protein